MTIHTILDNRWVQRFFLPLAIFNLYKSYILTKKEYSIIKQTINTNDDFFKSIVTLGFVPTTKFSMSSILPYDNELKIEDIREIANKTIIGVILQYVKDENLLGILTVDCKIDKAFIVTTIQPVTLKILVTDMFDTIISIVITTISIIAILHLI